MENGDTDMFESVDNSSSEELSVHSDSEQSSGESDEEHTHPSTVGLPLLDSAEVAWRSVELTSWALNPSDDPVYVRLDTMGKVTSGIFCGESGLSKKKRSELSSQIEEYLAFDGTVLEQYQQLCV